MQSDSFVAWRHKIGRGHNVAYIESSEQAAATVNKAWRDPDGGYVAAMDFSKAFDHMAPELSKQAMIAAGWPENIATLMAEVWKAQRRTVCFGGHQDPISLRTTHAHPQGGPLGPTVCQLWLLGGAEWTAEQRHSRRNSVAASEEKAKETTEPAQRKRRKPNDKREVDAGYMDDRSLVRGDARALVTSVKDWQAWSEGVQMQENWSKLQMMGKTDRQQEQLKVQVDEAGRPQWAWNSKRLGLKGAARHLKWMAEGARTHLTPVIASRLIGVVNRLKQAGEADWMAPAHTVVATLKNTGCFLG